MRTGVIGVAVALALGAGGCGAKGTGGDHGKGKGGGGVGASGRSGDAGAYTKARARAELDASAADAGAPRNDPRWVAMEKSAQASRSPLACVVQYQGFGTRGKRLDLPRFEAVVGELRERGWQRSGEREERRAGDGTVSEARQAFTKRGWSLVAMYWGVPETGRIGLVATEDACVARAGGEPGQGFPHAKLLP
ncbi:hypothetical protein GCM10017752_48820 [Streptomyces roseoviridis]